jgi:ATP-dependent DNA ligase
MLRKIPFMKPMAPTLAKLPPTGPEWLHEVKFDGWRVQARREWFGHPLQQERNGLHKTLSVSPVDDRAATGQERYSRL